MVKIRSGRYCAGFEGKIAVFLIGLRVNRWWKLPRILWVNRDFNKMMAELEQNPDFGLLGYESWLGNPTLMVQYWRSRDHLFEYARNPNASHAPAWGKYMRTLGSSNDFGLWHETYEITPGTSESLYLNMPGFGLGKATTLRSK